MRATTSLLSILSLTVGVAGQSLEPRVHDLRALLRPEEQQRATDQREAFVRPMAFPLARGDFDLPEPGALWVESALGRTADATALVEWLVAAVRQTGDPGVVRTGVARGMRVLIEADPAVHARLAKRINDLESAALRAFTLELVRLPASAWNTLAANAPLDEAAVTALLVAHPPLGVWRAAGRTGVPIVFRAGESRSYLRDVDVEIARDSVAFDPHMGILATGLRATFDVARAAGGGAFVTCALRFATAPNELPTIEFEQGNLQTPAVATELHECRVRVPGDGAFVIGARGDHASAWLVRVRGLGGVRPDAVPLGGVEDVPWAEQRLDRLGARPLHDPDEDETGVDGVRDGELLPEELRDVMTAHDNAEDAPGIVLGDSWIVARESAWTGRMRSLAAACADGRSVSIRYAIAVVGPDGAAQVPGPEADAADLAGSAGLVGVLRARVGDPVVALVGVERKFVADQSVEVAEKASAANPSSDSWFDGVAVELVARTEQDGVFRVAGGIGVQRPSDAPQRLDPRSYDAGLIDSPAVEHARIVVDADLPNGGWRCVGVQAIGTSGTHAVVLVRIDG